MRLRGGATKSGLDVPRLSDLLCFRARLGTFASKEPEHKRTAFCGCSVVGLNSNCDIEFGLNFGRLLRGVVVSSFQSVEWVGIKYSYRVSVNSQVSFCFPCCGSKWLHVAFDGLTDFQLSAIFQSKNFQKSRSRCFNRRHHNLRQTSKPHNIILQRLEPKRHVMWFQFTASTVNCRHLLVREVQV